MMHFEGSSKELRFHSNCDEKPSKILILNFSKAILFWMENRL